MSTSFSPSVKVRHSRGQRAPEQRLRQEHRVM